MNRFTRWTAICFIAATICRAEQAGKAESSYAPGDSLADTNSDSEFWREAPAIIARNDSRGFPVPGFKTEIRSRWTRDNLYFLFICPYQQLNLKPDPKPDAETNELWKWDVAEVFVGSDFKHIRRYKEFEMSPRGEWVDLDIDLDAPHHQDAWMWNSGFKVSARIDPIARTWYGFMRIPYAAIDSRAATAGNTLRINFFLSEGKKPDHKQITWQPTQKSTFHVPEAFGILTLVK